MRVITGRNVNHLYPDVVALMRREGVVADSRNGGVTVLPSPFCAVYERPDEMVLLDPARGANPFFHLVESLWMLGARSDAAMLNNYVKDFGARFANDEGNLDGAYGVRWRDHFPSYKIPAEERPGSTYDQLDDVVEKLSKNPLDRRIVIQMWNPTVDNNPETRDACCNQQLFPRIVDGRLDFTLTCRSNDAVWGALGANCVHFPMLQRYLAGRLGIPIGKFYQISNNYHLYDALSSKIGTPRPGLLDPYLRGEITPEPIGTDFDVWDEDLHTFLEWHDALWSADRSADIPEKPVYTNRWFKTVASVAALSFWKYRHGSPETAREIAAMCSASDWRCGMLLWLDQAALKAAGKAKLEPVPGPAPTAEDSSEAPDQSVGDVRPA